MSKKDLWNQLPVETQLKAARKMGKLAAKGVGVAMHTIIKIDELNKNKEKAKLKN